VLVTNLYQHEAYPVNLLHIDSSILGGQSVSRQVSAAAVAALVAENPGAKVTYRDLDAQPAPHQSGALMAARGLDPADRNPEQVRDLADADALLDDFLAADVVVIGVPMYNFGIPSTLKSWIDHLSVAGKTFSYSEAGPKGLAGGKRIVLASSRGGFYGADTPTAFLQHQESYLRGVFGFFGIPDVEVVSAEGVNYGPDHKQKALESAVAHAGSLGKLLQAA
jgi:FMN-dependent NADH-azoreductase